MRRPLFLLVVSLLLALGSDLDSSSVEKDDDDELRERRQDPNMYLSVVMVGRHDDMRGRISADPCLKFIVGG
jgi:hypothetical protein